MSSTVSTPANPPYSSTTTASSSSAARSASSTAGRCSESGTTTAGRAMSRTDGVALLLGQRENVAQADHADDVVGTVGQDGVAGVARGHAPDQLATVASAGAVATRGRGIIAARAGRSSNSRTRSSTADRSARRSPRSRDSSMIASRSRGVAECSTSWTRSIRSARSSRFDEASNSRISHPKSIR